jgi:hypothetical protein
VSWVGYRSREGGLGQREIGVFGRIYRSRKKLKSYQNQSEVTLHNAWEKMNGRRSLEHSFVRKGIGQ